MARELLEWDQGLGEGGLPEPRAFERTPASLPLHATDDEDIPLARTIADASVEPSSAPATALPPLASAPTLDADARVTRLDVLATEARTCKRCRLHEGRTKSVFSRGRSETELVFVGEGPGYNEDQAGEPFVGKAGQLLDKMIAAMGYARDDVYICNVVKCRPPENRTPLPDEAKACGAFLDGQLEAIQPKVIVALGRCAAERLDGLKTSPRGWRGRWSTYRGVPVMSTYHPAFLLRSPEQKRPVWEDLQEVMKRLGKSPPEKR
jgi:DNA polymerase